MAQEQPPVELQTLRRKLEASRWDLRCAVDDLEHSLNLPSRAKEAIVNHPMRYVMIALAGGAVATRVLPLLFKLGKPTRSAKMMRSVLQAVVPLAAPYVLRRLAERQYAAAPDHLPQQSYVEAPAPAPSQALVPATPRESLPYSVPVHGT